MNELAICEAIELADERQTPLEMLGARRPVVHS
jgi:hypothetical protein